MHGIQFDFAHVIIIKLYSSLKQNIGEYMLCRNSIDKKSLHFVGASYG